MKKINMSQGNNLTFCIITLSDRASKGEYQDLSGPAIADQLKVFFADKNYDIKIEKHLIPDNPDMLRDLLLRAKNESLNVVFTTGGTGIGPRDFTPDVAKGLFDKEIPGVMEMIRVKYGMVKPNALVSRSVAGTMGNTLVYTLPGSLRAVVEYCSEILPTIMHSIKMLAGIDDHS